MRRIGVISALCVVATPLATHSPYITFVGASTARAFRSFYAVLLTGGGNEIAGTSWKCWKRASPGCGI